MNRQYTHQPAASDSRRSYGTAYLLLGACFYSLSCFRDCILCNKRALEANPDFAEAHSNQGNVLRELGQLEMAVELYKRAIVLKPNFVEVCCRARSPS